MGEGASNILDLYPFISLFRQDRKERWYSTLFSIHKKAAQKMDGVFSAAMLY